MTSRLSRGSTGVVLALGVAALLPAAALAQDAPDFTMTWDASNDSVGANTYNWNNFGSLNGFGTWSVGQDSTESGPWTGWSYSGSLAGQNEIWTLEWDCVFNESVGVSAGANSAFVTANIVVTNNDIMNQNFSLLMTLPLSQVFLNPLERGSIVGTVTDLSFDDATVFAPQGGQIYTPMIDGADEVAGYLMGGGFSESAGGPLLSNTVGPADFGIPMPIAASQNADDSIGILLDFDLTPGDSASFTAIFEVLIPGPGALPLMALALLAGRRRRR